MIRLIQCMCPKRHAIMGLCYDDNDIDSDLALRGFKVLMEDAVEGGFVNRRCEICDADIEFRYEDAVTTFRSVQEAEPQLAKLEAEQVRTRQRIIAMRRAMNN